MSSICSEHYTAAHYLYSQSLPGGGWGGRVAQHKHRTFPWEFESTQLSTIHVTNVMFVM